MVLIVIVARISCIDVDTKQGSSEFDNSIFSVDDQAVTLPVSLFTQMMPPLRDGTNVSVVGKEKDGVLHAIAIHSECINFTYVKNVIKHIIFGFIFVLVGFLGIKEWWGIFGIILGFFLLYSPYTVYFKAKKMLQNISS